jgi:hypothetical protein
MLVGFTKNHAHNDHHLIFCIRIGI